MQWKKCCFSSDGDYIIGGSAQKSQHNIYIWNREEGQLIKTLEGPKEGIMDLVVGILRISTHSGTPADPSLCLSPRQVWHTSGLPTTRRIGAPLHQILR